MNYLLKIVETYRVATVEDVERLHQAFLEDSSYELIAFSYKTKYIKAKGQIVEEYQVVSATKIFNDEKEPERLVSIKYGE